MPKFMPKPVSSPDEFEALQWTHPQPTTIKQGDWIIVRRDGTSSYCDDKWFRQHYVEVK